ncbi:phage terminase small subunit [Streptomyces reniochalinae]
MAGFGPPPKDNARRRNADTFGAEPGAVPLDAAEAPQLPTPKRWLKLTREWWQTWADSSQSAHFTATDWQRLLALLPLVDSYHRLTVSANAEDTRKMRAALEIIKEIRQNESLLGATHVDRLRGRMTSTGPGKPADGPTAPVLDLSAYKEMFTAEGG